MKDRTSKRRCKWWRWRWCRRCRWTAMCDRWKWRSLYLTRLAKISGDYRQGAFETGSILPRWRISVFSNQKY